MSTGIGIAVPVIVVLAIIAALLIVIVAAIFIIRSKVQKFSMEAFGTKDILQGKRDMEARLAETPKSLRSMTQIYLPQIKKDFPEFDYKNNVTGIIEDLNVRGLRQTFSEVAIHDVELARYDKNGVTVTILFNAAVGCFDFVEDGSGKVVFGSRELKKQCVYDIELIYVQDVHKMGVYEEGALGLTCPNCGAPIKTLGQKFCEYCGGGVQEINTRSWSYESIREQTVNKTAYK